MHKRTFWKDHVTEHPKRRKIIDVGGGLSDLEDAQGRVLQKGTPMSAANFNNMEDGIQDAVLAGAILAAGLRARDDAPVVFEQSSERTELTSGEKLSTLIGKIKKWFSDLKNVAFTGKYSDLSDTPEALKNPQPLSFTGGATDTYDGSEAKTVKIPSTAADVGAPLMKDSEQDWAVIEGHTPDGNAVGLYFNRGGFVYAAAFNDKGEQQFGKVLYGEGNPPSPKDVGAVAKTGDTMTGGLSMAGPLVVGNKVSMRADGEGGNIDITPPDGFPNQWEIDAYDGNLRLINLDPTKPNGLTVPLILNRNPAESVFAGVSALAERVRNPITFPGGASGSWDGSAPLSVKIPSTAADVGAPGLVDSDLDWGMIDGYTPSGNHISLAFNKKEEKVYVSCAGPDGALQWNQALYGTRHPPTAEEVGALPTSGGTLTGDLWAAGGIAGLIYGPDSGGRLCLIPPPGFGIRDWDIDGYNGVLRIFAARTDGSFFFPLFISEAATSVNNTLVVGNKVSLRADNEGGNISITPPDGFPNNWEIDAYDGNLRFINFDPTQPNGLTVPLILNRNPEESVFAGAAGRVAHPLTFTGGASGSWDGSENKSVKIPGKLADLADGVLEAGAAISIRSLMPLPGIVTSGSNMISVTLSLSSRVGPGLSARVESLRGTLRGTKGYIDGSSEIDFMLSGEYTVSTMIEIDVGLLRITIEKSSEFTNVENNTPVNLMVSAFTAKFVRSSDEPIPGPEIFGDDAGMEGPSLEGDVGQTYAPTDAENAESADTESSGKSDTENAQTERTEAEQAETEQAETERTETEQAETDTVTDDADEAVPEAEETEDEV